MRASRVVLLVVGVLVALFAFALLLGGAALVGIHTTQRDASGYYTSAGHTFTSSAFAITSEKIDLGEGVREGDWSPVDDLGTLRLRARSLNEGAVFLGVALEADVDRYLADSAHDEIDDISLHPFDVHYRRESGASRPTPPTRETFWVAQSSGLGRQTLHWEVDHGDWAVVVMNADARRGVDVRASAGIKTDLLLPVGIGLLGAGLLIALVAALLIVLALRGHHHIAGGPTPSALAPSGAYPLRVDGHLDEPLNRALWLVKWFLAIPHLVLLAFLWIAAWVVTVIAGFAILFTGRYPRGLFAFVVGVARWTWRVGFYAFTLGTDRYPPFSLSPDAAYPAQLSVEYPERLSRGLVLVKWWLLAIPQYVIVAIFLDGGAWGWSDGGGRGGAPGLVGVLVLIAGVVLLFTGRYPRPIFNFVMGMLRWSWRVFAYVALLRDEYPPFRLDMGGEDTGSDGTGSVISGEEA